MMAETTTHSTLGSTSEIAVKIQNVYKRHSKSNIVLNGLNMTVPKGKMWDILFL